jgi:hypothetical protein
MYYYFKTNLKEVNMKQNYLNFFNFYLNLIFDYLMEDLNIFSLKSYSFYLHINQILYLI